MSPHVTLLMGPIDQRACCRSTTCSGEREECCKINKKKKSFVVGDIYHQLIWSFGNAHILLIDGTNRCLLLLCLVLYDQRRGI